MKPTQNQRIPRTPTEVGQAIDAALGDQRVFQRFTTHGGVITPENLEEYVDCEFRASLETAPELAKLRAMYTRDARRAKKVLRHYIVGRAIIGGQENLSCQVLVKAAGLTSMEPIVFNDDGAIETLGNAARRLFPFVMALPGTMEGVLVCRDALRAMVEADVRREKGFPHIEAMAAMLKVDPLRLADGEVETIAQAAERLVANFWDGTTRSKKFATAFNVHADAIETLGYLKWETTSEESEQV